MKSHHNKRRLDVACLIQELEDACRRPLFVEIALWEEANNNNNNSAADTFAAEAISTSSSPSDLKRQRRGGVDVPGGESKRTKCWEEVRNCCCAFALFVVAFSPQDGWLLFILDAKHLKSLPALPLPTYYSS